MARAAAFTDPLPAAPSIDELDTLMCASGQGCRRSFARVYELTHSRLLAIVSRMVRHRGQAEEVLQDIYVKVWFRGKQFDPDRGRALHWLSRTATRAALDALRANAARPRESCASDDDESPYDRLVSNAETPLDHCARQQQADTVRRELDLLPHLHRESLLLAFFEDLTHQEISNALGCPLGTIKSRVRRGLQSMRPAVAAYQ